MSKASEEQLPLVSVGIPTYNGSNRVLKAARTVLEQNYDNVEIIVSDNCSTDDTAERVKEFQQSAPQVKFYLQEKNLGIAGNFNFVLKHATGKYFIWLGDDDKLEKGVLKKYVDFLEQNPDYVLASGNILHWRDDELMYTEKGFTLEQNSAILRALKYYNRVKYCAMFHGMIRRDKMKDFTNKDILGDDWHMLAKLAYRGKMKNFDFPGYHKQTGGASKDMHDYAISIGHTEKAASHPYLKIAKDAFSEVYHSTSVYTVPALKRRWFGLLAFFSVLMNYYAGTYPRIVGGKLKRLVLGDN